MKHLISDELVQTIQSKITELEELLSISRIDDNDLVGENLMREFHKEMQQLHGGATINSGISPIDAHFHGFGQGNYILIAARTSVGKSALALSIAFNLMKQKKKVLFIAMEMTAGEIIMRLASMYTKIPIWKFRKYQNTYASPLLHDFNDLISEKNLIVLNELSEENLRIKIKLMHEKYGLDAVFIDYIGLISSKDQKHGENQVLTRISRNIKLCAIENKLPIFVLSQLNRESVKRKDDKPILVDIRSSGSIEQDSDIVMLLYRYKEHSGGNLVLGPVTEIIVGKNRNGYIGVIDKLSFDHDTAKFAADEQSVPTVEQIEMSKTNYKQTKFDDDPDF
jgi:replicative DNA helicase